MTTPEQLFQHFLNPENIEQAARDQVPESTILDFKVVKENPSGSARFTKGEQSDCREAFGAMANVSGGVVVWGVISTERGSDDDFEILSEARPFKGVTAFVRQLNNFMPFDSPSAELRHEAVFTDADKDQGYVVSMVGKAKPLPVMSSDGRYYVRSASNSQRLGDNQVRALMQAQQLPSIEFKISRGYRIIDDLMIELVGGWHRWEVWVDLANTGFTRLREVAWIAWSEDEDVQVKRAIEGRDFRSKFRGIGPEDLVLHVHPELVLHPGQQVSFLSIEGRFHSKQPSSRSEVQLKVMVGDIALDFQIAVTPQDLTEKIETFRKVE